MNYGPSPENLNIPPFREDVLEFSRIHELRAMRIFVVENACAGMLLKHVHYLQDVEGRRISLHYARDKEGREVDFVVCENAQPIGLAECKLADPAAGWLAQLAA